MSAWAQGLAGGLMIGAAAALLFWVNGRIAGVSGIAVRAFGERGFEAYWRWVWLGGLAAGGFVALLAGADFEPRTGYPVPMLVAAGLLVGFGTRIGNGCTSGHGVCGVSRLSRRSVAATATFIAVAMLTTFVVRHLWGLQ
ncbi:MAG: YeeE/YedE family protein [Gammaproteobacteria bacterium]